MENNKISIFVLAGGKSSRMGTNKANLVYEGKTLLERSLELAKSLSSRVYISGAGPSYYKYNTELIKDNFVGIGPIGGFEACLNFSTTEINVMLSCDTPFIKKEHILKLIDKLSSYDLSIPKHEDNLEPLISVFHKRCHPKIMTQIKSGDFKLHNLIKNLDTIPVNFDNEVRETPKLFQNFNRPSDLL